MNKIISNPFLYLAPKNIQLLTCITLKRFKKKMCTATTEFVRDFTHPKKPVEIPVMLGP